MGDYIWAGNILRVNLSTGRISQAPTSDYISYAIGGRGIGQYIMFREIPQGTHPYDPENILIFSAGALVGTLAPASCRLHINTMNAFTGGVCSTNSGGHFAPELKYAGFDAIVVSGKAERPVFIWIHNGKAEIRNAESIWGMDTWQTESKLRQELGEPLARVASIGSAGERLIRGACIIVDRARAAGRGGSGAVMGSKKLKAIVVRGEGGLFACNQEGFINEVNRCWEKLGSTNVYEGLNKYGTMWYGAGGLDGKRPQAVRNYQDSYWDPEKSKRISEPNIRGKYEVRRLSGFNCPIACSHYYAITEGPYAGVEGEGFEANTARAFGSNLDIDYAPFIIQAHVYCSRHGYDLDTAGASMAFAFEAYQRGHLTKSDTDGLELTWGNHVSANELLKSIVERRGIGDVLAEGVKRAAAVIGAGSEDYALHIKNADINEASMRIYKAYALGIVLSTHGGGHLDGAAIGTEWSSQQDKAIKMFGTENPGAAGEYFNQSGFVTWHQDNKAVIDMLGVCYFTSMWLDPNGLSIDDFAALLSSGSGQEFTPEHLLMAGRRLRNVAKAFNTLHTDQTRADDLPPARLTEPVQKGPFKGQRLEIDKWELMLDEYYKSQGWDIETGLQTKESLISLGLEEVVEKLKRAGKL